MKDLDLRNHRSDKEELARIATGVMTIRGLEPEFSFQVREQLHQIDGPASSRDISVMDLRSLPWCSIDNDDSKDLDQLTVTKKSGSKGWALLVAIADVDALVPRGTAIDEHALLNTRSVYVISSNLIHTMNLIRERFRAI